MVRALDLQFEAPSSSPALTASWICEFKSRSATLVNSQLVCLRPVGILNLVKCDLNYLFQAFSRIRGLVTEGVVGPRKAKWQTFAN